jgi:hypothetical protein
MAGTKLGEKRGPYKPKQLKFEHTCEKCNILYKSADVKGKICTNCKLLIEVHCKCGCGKKLFRHKWQIDIGRTYWPNHDKSGKKYIDIYGTNTPSCGFRTGKDNPMSDPKILESVLSKINKGKIIDGLRLRSSYEVELYKILKSGGYLFEYEPIIKTSDGTYFKPDFVINNRIFIEVSGYASAYESGRVRNLYKMESLVDSYDILIFITTGRFIGWYKENIKSEKVVLLNYEDLLKTNEILWEHLK